MYELIQAGGIYPNITTFQFMRWNPTVDYTNIMFGEVFCVG